MKNTENFIQDINKIRNADFTQDWEFKVFLFNATCEYYGIGINHEVWNEEFDGLNVQNESIEVVRIWFKNLK